MIRLCKYVRQIEIIRNLNSIQYIIPLNTYGNESLGKQQSVVVKSDSVEISFEILKEEKSPALKAENISNQDV